MFGNLRNDHTKQTLINIVWHLHVTLFVYIALNTLSSRQVPESLKNYSGMYKRLIVCLIITSVIFSGYLKGQRFVSIIDINEISSLTGSSCIANLKTGEKTEGTIKGLSVTTGYLSGVIIKLGNGQKEKLKTGQIESFLVKSSGFTDMTAVPSGTVTRNNMTISTPGKVAEADYIVFESVNTGKLSGELLLQWLNPGSDSKIKVYAYETDSGNTVSVNDDKKGTTSFTGKAAITYLFVKSGEKPVKIQKSNFRNRLKEVFSDCPSLLSKINDNKIRWDDIAEYVYTYNKDCK